MDDLIVLKNGAGALAPETVTKIAEYERRMKELKEQEEALNTAIKEEMEAKNLIKLENEELVISYVAETDRISFDSKRFEKDHPEMYDEYLKISKVKSSIRIKLR